MHTEHHPADDDAARRTARHRSGSRPHRRMLAVLAPLAALAVGAALLLAPAASQAAARVAPGKVTGDVLVHDPSMVRGPDGTYLLAATAPGIALRTSVDRTAFTYRGVAFPGGAPWTDAWTGTSNGNLWAPDLSYRNGQYYLYYAASSFGSNKSAIFLATSPTGLPGTWTHRGLVYSTTTSSDHNAIDPSLYVADDGRWWLTFGSFWTGLKQLELDPATGLRRGTSLRSVAARPGSTALEAPAVIKHGSSFYLFMSWDRCCQGAASTYRIMVGRATSVGGPYLDCNGVALTQGGGTQVLASSGRYVGPGGQSVLADADGELLVYHYYDAQDGGRAKLGVNLLGWDTAGWPYVR